MFLMKLPKQPTQVLVKHALEGCRSGATTWTVRARSRKAAAASSAMKLPPTMTTCFADLAFAAMARLSLKEAQVVKVRINSTRNTQLDRFGAGSKKERAKVVRLSVLETDLFPFWINVRNSRFQHKVDAMTGVIVRRPQRDPIVLGSAGR